MSAAEERPATILARAPDLVLMGRKVVGGVAEGRAFATRQTISGWGGIDPMTGTIIEKRHEAFGESFAGRVLLFPGAKGSSGWSALFHMARLAGRAPLAMVFNVMTTKAALGAVVMRIPTVTGLDRDPLDLVQSGDWVRVDGEAGKVAVWKATGGEAGDA